MQGPEQFVSILLFMLERLIHDSKFTFPASSLLPGC